MDIAGELDAIMEDVRTGLAAKHAAREQALGLSRDVGERGGQARVVAVQQRAQAHDLGAQLVEGRRVRVFTHGAHPLE